MAEPNNYLEFLDRQADKYGVPRAEARALYELETKSGRAVATSPKGAMGRMQVMPATFAAMGGTDPNNDYQNIAAGVHYYAQQRQRFGNPALAAAAYNAGPTRVAKVGGVPNFTETRNYVRNFLDRVRPPARTTPNVQASAITPPSAVRPVTPQQSYATLPSQQQPPQLAANVPPAPAPQQQGVKMTEDGTEDGGSPLQMANYGGGFNGQPIDFNQLRGPNSGAIFNALQQRILAQQAAQEAALRKQQADAEGRLNKRYAGPGASEQLYAIGQALLSPSHVPGWKGALGNVNSVFGQIAAANRNARSAREDALDALRQRYSEAIAARQGGGDKSLLDLLKTYGSLNQTEQDYSATPNGVIFNKRTGYPKPQGDHVKGLLEHPDRAQEFDMKFGPGAAAEVLSRYGQGASS